MEGKRKVGREIKIYNLDAILSVGYRVNSKQGTHFRIWATEKLKKHLIDGYTINQSRLNQLKQSVQLIQATVNTQGASKDVIARFFTLSVQLSIFLQFIALALGAQTNRKVLIENEVLRVEIRAEGAELQSIKHLDAEKEYLWQGDTTYWEDRSPIMFPVNVRFKDNQFIYKGKTYEMPKMGLAIGSTFKVLPSNRQEKISLELRSSESTLESYPFPFKLVATYRLDSNKLVNEFQIENLGVDTMYFALGGHPGFRFPDTAKTRADYAYTFSENMHTSRTEIAESLVQKSIIPFLKNENQLGLDDQRIPANGSGMFLKNIDCQQVGLALKGQPPFIKIDLGDFSNVNLWSPPGSPYACIEPMIGHHDLVDSPPEIENKSFLVKLPPHYSKRYSYTIICE